MTDAAGDRVTIGERLFVLSQKLLPQHGVSRLVHRFARIRRPWVRRWSIRLFRKLYDVDLDEAAEPDPEAYPSFNAFFTRALGPGARPLAGGDDTVVCPADGTLSQAGRIEAGRLFQAKGHHYGAPELLADPVRASAYESGWFATVYLAPSDYHRVHMPHDGRLVAMSHVPGALYSVNAVTTRHVPRLFTRNERVVCHFETAHGPMAVVLVGAINVGSIATVWAGEVRGRRDGATHWHYEGLRLARGDELGRFNLGSTVIVLGTEALGRPVEGLRTEQIVRVGQALAVRS
jgi:phosphatidylserine decarboxylase